MRRLAGILSLALGCANGPSATKGANGPTAASTAAPAKHGAPVVVAIVVDQLAAWVARERLPVLPDGGFARLLREGTWVFDMTYLHASTETAPGHASLFTGRTPRETGIVGNGVYRRDLGRTTSLIEDPSTKLVGPDGKTTRAGVSLAKLEQPTLADALLARDPAAVVVALSIKDRGAVFAGGRKPTASVWYDSQTGMLGTSSAFAERLPAWTSGLDHPLGAAAGTEWKLFDRTFVEGHAATPDDQPGESSELGSRTFPHLLPTGPAGGKAYPTTPMADALIVDLAIRALDAARHPDHPMLLAMSLSANDYIGHAFGPDSWEAWDELVRLNELLGRFFAVLDAKIGADGYAVVLSGDHGVGPLPETVSAASPWCGPNGKNPYAKPCGPCERIVPAELKRALEQDTRAIAPGKTMIQDGGDSVVFLTDDARALPADARARLDERIRKTLGAQAGVAEVLAIPTSHLSCPSSDDESVAALVCRSTSPGLGDYYVVTKPGSFFWAAKSEGASHGSPHRYDRTVPLIVRYPGAPGGTTMERTSFGSYYASLWYALTGEITRGPYGGVVGPRR